MIDKNPVRITNPEKLLWPNLGIRKIDYISRLLKISDYILPHSRHRLLTTIRYPDGVAGKSFYQKNIPKYAPAWLETSQWKDTNYIVLNSKAALAWLANQAVLEFHTSFNPIENNLYPSSLVFDLDPSKGQTFDEVVEVAFIIHDTLEALQIKSWCKTSGATGLQIYIPIGKQYDYDTARRLNHFFGLYFSQKYPQLVTIERMVDKRGRKLYFDYLQMWQGKTITMVYSPRATPEASISTPIEWDELNKGMKPADFNLLNIKERLDQKGDLFSALLDKSNNQSLDHILGAL